MTKLDDIEVGFWAKTPINASFELRACLSYNRRLSIEIAPLSTHTQVCTRYIVQSEEPLWAFYPPPIFFKNLC